MDLLTEADAVLSDCGTYRYRLDRTWGPGPKCVFIMLNPSTADATQDDPTIRRCIGFAKREECGSLTVVNLMAYRATKPVDLPDGMQERAGPDNGWHVRRVLSETAGPIILAWGANKLGRAHAIYVKSLIERTGKAAYALHVNADGSFKHPLYVAADAPLIEVIAARRIEA